MAFGPCSNRVIVDVDLKIPYQKIHSPTPRNDYHMSAANTGYIFLQIPHHVMDERMQGFVRRCRRVCRHLLTGWWAPNGALTCLDHCLCPVFNVHVVSQKCMDGFLDDGS